jgi:hypothetical protein
MTSYPVMLLASYVLAGAAVGFAVAWLIAWAVHIWLDVLRQRTPIMKGDDGVWRAARRRR